MSFKLKFRVFLEDDSPLSDEQVLKYLQEYDELKRKVEAMPPKIKELWLED